MRVFLGVILGLLVVPVVGLCVMKAGLFPVQATAKPPAWERGVANMALDPAVDREAKGLTSPISGSEDDIVRGMKIYRDDCAGCHGDRVLKSSWGRNNFYPPAPELGHHAMDDPIPNIFVIVKYGVRYTGMAGWKGEIPDEDIWRVATFLHEMDKLPPRANSLWMARQQPAGTPPSEPEGKGEGKK